MKKNKKSSLSKYAAPPELSEQAIRSYHTLLDENITEYDCGSLCSVSNNGIPFCCDSTITIPLLYRSELSMLQKMGELWSIWKPSNNKERRLAKQISPHEIYCECTGAARCKREQRSIACRTFPLEPYIDNKGVLTGLVFIPGVLSDDRIRKNMNCPLTDKTEDIRQEYIDSTFAFWKTLLKIPAEYNTYLHSSRAFRKQNARSGIQALIFYPSTRIQDYQCESIK